MKAALVAVAGAALLVLAALAVNRPQQQVFAHCWHLPYLTMHSRSRLWELRVVENTARVRAGASCRALGGPGGGAACLV
jgi:hypothetical protein